MFYGEYNYKIDNKGRLFVPSKFKRVLQEEVSSKFFITRGLEGCLMGFAESGWRKEEERLKSMPFQRKDARRFQRLFFSGVSETEMDSQGRILIPDYLKKYAELKNDAKIIGVSHYFEIWDPKKWEVFKKESEDSFEEIAERL
ncbi:division/cell wall cluster transcriptional repressor MraZ [bacterium Unc6]|nr:division/cell wall cluster transcriptional repressor MraZ [bacterium Unc6]